MDAICQCICNTGLPKKIAHFITYSVRRSSLKTYESVRKSWLKWCSACIVDRSNPLPLVSIPGGRASPSYIRSSPCGGVFFQSSSGGQIFFLLSPSTFHEGGSPPIPPAAQSSLFLFGHNSSFAIHALIPALGALVSASLMTQVICFDSDLFLLKN